ncbi:endochitinase A-like isoform X2 [Agrilus planipennis]|uniref:Endochitinase A-like isoform X2 n=1 Tax=Agrilus planipennis TaxID=224129 RepID=A0A1W4WQD1_AGRPL|nr:endochitinase A-like isoform X2 [Agrilus planipennis]
MIFNLLLLQIALNALLTEALEDPDLVRNCGDAKALALGLNPTKAYLPPHPQPQVQYYSQPQISVESAHIQPQIQYISEPQPQPQLQYNAIQPELHIKSVAYTTPPVGISYAPAAVKSAEQNYAVTAGLSTYGSPKYLLGAKSSSIPSSISSYSSSSSQAAAAQASSSHSSSNSYSSILSAPKLASGISVGTGSEAYSYGSNEALGYGSNYGGVSAYEYSAPAAVSTAVKSVAVPFLSAKISPSIQYASKETSSAAAAASASAASAYNSQLSTAAYNQNIPIGVKYAPTVLSPVSKYSLASDVSSNYLSSDAYNSKNIYAASVKPAVSVGYAASPVLTYNSPVTVQKVLDNSLSSGSSSSYSSSSSSSEAQSSLLGSSIKAANPVVYSAPSVYSTGTTGLGSSSAGSKYSLASDVSTSYSSLGSEQGLLKVSSPAVYASPVVSSVYSGPSIQQSSSSSSLDLSQKGASSYSYSSVHAAPVPSIAYSAGPVVSKTSSSSSSANLAHGGSSSYSYSSGNLGSQIHGAPVASVAYAAPSSVIQKSSSVSSNLAHDAASSYSYSSGNLGQVGAVGVKNLVTAPVAVKVPAPAPAIAYASFPSVSTSHISGDASGHGQGLVAAAPTAFTYVTPDSNGKAGKDHEKEKHGKYYNAHPQYYFEYYVNDPHTGDIKEQKEERNGDIVNGHYSLVEPDGNIRTVSYKADWETGFHATVTNSKRTVKA